MAKTIFTIGRNTKIQVCPSHTCDYVLPVDVAFTVATGGAIVGATSIPITAVYRDWETDRKSTRLNSSH